MTCVEPASAQEVQQGLRQILRSFLGQEVRRTGQVLDRATAAGTVRASVTRDDLRPLMCGVAYAVALHADGRESRLESGLRYLGVMLRGLRA